MLTPQPPTFQQALCPQRSTRGATTKQATRRSGSQVMALAGDGVQLLRALQLSDASWAAMLADAALRVLSKLEASTEREVHALAAALLWLYGGDSNVMQPSSWVTHADYANKNDGGGLVPQRVSSVTHGAAAGTFGRNAALSRALLGAQGRGVLLSTSGSMYESQLLLQYTNRLLRSLMQCDS